MRTVCVRRRLLAENSMEPSCDSEGVVLFWFFVVVWLVLVVLGPRAAPTQRRSDTTHQKIGPLDFSFASLLVGLRVLACVCVYTCRATAALQNQNRLLEVQLASSAGFPPPSVSHTLAEDVAAARDQSYFSVRVLFLRGSRGPPGSYRSVPFQRHPGSC